MARSNGSGDENQTVQAMELPLKLLPTSHPCTDCGACCRYIAIEIDLPTSFNDWENAFWYLTHRNIALYIDWEGDWFIEFMTTCEHLSDENTCGIYEERPKMCSDFSWDECEKNTKEIAWKYHFSNPDELFDWLREKQPAKYEKYQKSRRKLKEKRSEQRSATPTEDSRPNLPA
jgi:Fe-S-cluster containining protein